MRREELMLKLRGTLAQRRAALLQTLAGQQNLIAAKGDSPRDRIDAALDCEQGELSSQLAAVESRELAAVDEALERNGKGLYGICNDCEKPIPIARLQALPYATRCLKCQREEERYGRTEGTAFSWEEESELMLAD